MNWTKAKRPLPTPTSSVTDVSTVQRAEFGTSRVMKESFLRGWRGVVGLTVGHVDEARVVTLERDGHRRSWTIPVFGDDEVCFAGTW